jgi:DNA-binding FrmR family transcriptional regulator
MAKRGASPGYIEDKDLLQKRLRRIEGQVRGLQRMVEEDRYCIDVLQQASAVKAAIDEVALRLVDGHVSHCMTEATGDQKHRDAMADELMGAVARLVRS